MSGPVRAPAAGPRSAVARRGRAGRLAALLGALAVLLLLTASPARAHAMVEGSDPADGADVARLPAQVSIRFDEGVGLAGGYLHVVDDRGVRRDTGAANHPPGDDRTVEVALRPGPSAPSGYLVSYRVVSADSHVVAGTLGFTVAGGAPAGAAAAAATGGGAGGDAWTLTLRTTAAVAGLVGLAVAGGGWVVVSRRAGVLDTAAVRALVRGGLALAAAATLAQLALQGPYAAGRSPAAVADGALWRSTLATAFGTWHVVGLAGLAATAAGAATLRRRGGPLGRAGTAVLAGTAAAWALVLVAVVAPGHAGAARPVWLGLPLTAVHVAAAVTWTGGLLVLLAVVLPAGPAPGSGVLLRRFSAVALTCVGLLAVTGTVQAWQQTRGWDALAATSYGRLVLVKVALFAALVGLGALARRHVRRDDPVRALRGGVAVEAGVLAGVLLVSGVLAGEPPARQAYATQRAERPAVAIVALDAGRSVTVRTAHSRHGPLDVEVTLTGARDPQLLELTAGLPGAGIGPVRVPLLPDGSGRYRSSGVVLPAPGAWRLEVTLQTSQFDAVVGSGTLDLT